MMLYRWVKKRLQFLYGACCRIAKQMGYNRILTYILANERGTSLKASNRIRLGLCGGGSWSTPGRPRQESPNPGKKVMYSQVL
jgi:hypothetical protein